MLHRRRRSGPASTSTLAIAPSLAPVQTPVFALVLTSPINSEIARRSSAEGYDEGAREAVLTAVSTTSASVQVGKGASGRSSRTAWCPALRRQTRRLEVVRRSLPRNVPSLLTRRVGGLPCLHLLQHGRQLLVVDDRAGLNRLDLIEDLETERRSVELNRKPPVRIVHYLDLLAHQATGQRRRVEEQHHPVVVQGQVAGDRPLLPPGQDLVQIIGWCQRPMQVLLVRRVPPEAPIVGGNEPRQPSVRRGHRRYPRQPQLLDHPVLQRAERAFDASFRLRAVGADDVDVQRQQRATELGHAVTAGSLLAVHPEDAVLVAVESDRFAMLLQIGARRPEVIERRLRSDEPQLHQPARRIIDETEQRARRTAVLEPGMLRAVDLHQFAQAIAAPARLMRRGQTMPSILPQPVRDHPTAQRLARHFTAVMLG